MAASVAARTIDSLDSSGAKALLGTEAVVTDADAQPGAAGGWKRRELVKCQDHFQHWYSPNLLHSL